MTIQMRSTRFLLTSVSAILLVFAIQIGSATPGTAASSTWQTQQTGNSAALNVGIQGQVNSTSCVSTNFCVSGGSFIDSMGLHQAYVSVVNGSQRSSHEVGASLNVQGYAAIQSVSCVSSSFCVAVGSYRTFASGLNVVGNDEAIASVWDGQDWTDEIVGQSFNSEIASSLNSVSCLSQNFCLTAGNFADAQSNVHAFASVFQAGSWTDYEVATSFNDVRSSRATSVSCEENFCFVGGVYSTSTSSEAFISKYDSGVWSDQTLEQFVPMTMTGNAGGQAKVESVSCSSSTTCMAGGYYRDINGHQQAFASNWDGSTWTDHDVADGLNLGDFGEVTTVDCTNNYTCAVGGDVTLSSGAQQAFVSTQSHGLWTDTLVGQPTTTGDPVELNSISCVSATSCVAVGYDEDQSGNSEALVSTLVGTTWHDAVVASSIAANGVAYLASVSCVSSTYCLAGGSYQNAAGQTEPLLETFDGSTWSGETDATGFDSVASSNELATKCVSTNFCVAGGFYTDSIGLREPFVSTFNGSTWTDTPVGVDLNLGGFGEVLSLDCVSTTFCVAAGFTTNHVGSLQGFVSIFNGHYWTDAPVGFTNDQYAESQITSISCASSNFCAAVGRYTSANGHRQAFASTFNGMSWADSVVGGSLNSGNLGALQSVSCPSQNFCLAGGYIKDVQGSFQPLVEVYSSNQWNAVSAVPSAQPTHNAKVNSVSCVSPNLCVVGGTITNSISMQNAFVSYFDGSVWHEQDLVSGLNLGGMATVNSVSCATSNFCVASGEYESSTPSDYEAFVSTFNGTQWNDVQIASTLNVGQSASAYAVSCASPTLCVSGGAYFDVSDYNQALASSFTGNSWNDVELASDLNIGGNARVNGVNCIENMCVVAGAFLDSGNTQQSFMSTFSIPAAPVAPIHYAPTAPISPSVTLNGTTATVDFTPGSSGGLPTTYSVEEFANGTDQGDVCDVAAVTSCQVENLIPNTNYYFIVTASNALGQASSGVTNTVDDVVTTSTATTSTTTTTLSPPRKYTITCIKAKSIRRVTATKPVCPAGFKKK